MVVSFINKFFFLFELCRHLRGEGVVFSRPFRDGEVVFSRPFQDGEVVFLVLFGMEKWFWGVPADDFPCFQFLVLFLRLPVWFVTPGVFGVSNRCLWSGVSGLERHVGADFFQEPFWRRCWLGWPRRGLVDCSRGGLGFLLDRRFRMRRGSVLGGFLLRWTGPFLAWQLWPYQKRMPNFPVLIRI